MQCPAMSSNAVTDPVTYEEGQLMPMLLIWMQTSRQHETDLVVGETSQSAHLIVPSPPPETRMPVFASALESAGGRKAEHLAKCSWPMQML